MGLKVTHTGNKLSERNVNTQTETLLRATHRCRTAIHFVTNRNENFQSQSFCLYKI